MNNVEYEKEISKLGLVHYFYTIKNPIEVAARIKIAVDILGNDSRNYNIINMYTTNGSNVAPLVCPLRTDRYRITNIDYKCFSNDNIIKLNCMCCIHCAAHKRSRTVDIGIKQYLRQDDDCNHKPGLLCLENLMVVLPVPGVVLKVYP